VDPPQVAGFSRRSGSSGRLSVLSCCEAMADVEVARRAAGPDQGVGARAGKIARPGPRVDVALATLARAHALREHDPEGSGSKAAEAARLLDAAGLTVDAGRARLQAATALAAAGRKTAACADLPAAAQAFAAPLQARTIREQRRLGVRVPRRTQARGGPGPHGLSRREIDVAAGLPGQHLPADRGETLP
jgi:hypothetical protein